MTLRWLRMLWVLPLTLPGIVLYCITLMTGGKPHRIPGAIAVSGGISSWWMRRGPWRHRNLLAITIGQVIVARDALSLERTLIHELEHVRQGTRWGILFPFAYVAAGIMAMCRGGHYYDHNYFEIAACRAEQKKDRA